MKTPYFFDSSIVSTAIEIVTDQQYVSWLENQSSFLKTWLKSISFKPESGQFRCIPNEKGEIDFVLLITSEKADYLFLGLLPLQLPEGCYYFKNHLRNEWDDAIAWGLGAYQFERYKSPSRQPALLRVSESNLDRINNYVSSLFQVRDLINTPTDDMGPTELAVAARAMADRYHASFTVIEGNDLLAQNYPCIYTVGRASDDAPRLIDIRYGDESHPKITLVGKGVCFDTGGLDIKGSSYMLLMKKDMGGAANVLGLASLIMQAKLPIRLRVLIPAVENAISGNAYRPGDVIRSRKGMTIEVGNTDAEGRLVLCDAIAEAVSETPDLLIDMATLTGAARVAMGPELPVVFSNHHDMVNELMQIGESVGDPMWRLPLYEPYRDLITSQIADINNNASDGYGGAITAALFLKAFVPDTIPWFHFDINAWNPRPKPGRPQGGEAMAIRALFAFLESRYQ